MKRIAGIVAGALLFGVVAGASMVGVNVAAQKAGILYEQSVAKNNQSQSETQTFTQPESTAAESTDNTPKIQQSQPTATMSSVTKVAKDAMPSVVAITNMVKYRQNGFSIFGDFQSYETEVPASGSGVIIGKNDTELLILTNNHVVSSSESLSVTFNDSETVDAAIKGTDSAADLAVISIKLENIPTKTLESISIATLGDSDAMEVGDQVVAIGNALGYGQSVTTGIISAKDRDVSTTKGTRSGLLQTDAAINPGNSGGALLNMKGEVIGINVAKYTSTSIEGMGYSIPSSLAKRVVENLSTLETREDVPKEERGYLGVKVKNIDAQTAESFGMPQGVFVYKYTEGSNAQNSDLHEKDIITAVNGQGVTNFNELSTVLSKYRAGEKVTVTVQRPNGDKYDELNVDVVLGSADTSASTDKDGSSANDPFSRNDGSDGNNGSGNSNENNGDSGNQNNGNNGLSQDDILKAFQDFINQYQR
ncbi:S1C family serine protease [Oribacterium sp. WCC10]|uniref:S1C family serine protease n=1 Tax=Oribacterium sp. WCC10 TaxID=1855343 RepID=UPI0008E859B8|nr:trypsin-like peptidase domain-containing protein [Oribacterium sp. WCC10]SFG48433.1 serine protease Do [Oribacterium sp. WCC10]